MFVVLRKAVGPLAHTQQLVGFVADYVPGDEARRGLKDKDASRGNMP